MKNALIEAGAEILSKEGVNGLSLRKVASRAGVSHADPYAHFPDKQTLIAALSTEGYRMLYERLDAAVQRYRDDPLRQLVEACQAAGVLKPGPVDVMAVSVWSLVHGFVSLLQEGQISHSVLDRYSLREMLIFTLNQISRVEINPQEFSIPPDI